LISICCGQQADKSWLKSGWRVYASHPYFVNKNLNGHFEIGLEKGLISIVKSGKIGLRGGLTYRQFEDLNYGTTMNFISNLGVAYVFMFGPDSKLHFAAYTRFIGLPVKNDSPSFGLTPLFSVEFIKSDKFGLFVGYEYFNQGTKNLLTNGYETTYSNVIHGGLKYHF